MSRNPIQTKVLISQKTFHPKFNEPPADIILSSNPGTLFRMPSITMRTTSGLLRLFLADYEPVKVDSPHSTPEGHASGTDTGSPMDVISLPFDDAPIERVLLLLSAQPTEPWMSFAELEAAVNVMDYLDTPGPISYVRVSCFLPTFLSEPIRLYGLGARYGWEDVIQHAAELTLSLNLFPPSSPSDDESETDRKEIEDQLTRLPSTYLYRLLKMHRRRRDNFRELLFSSDMFSVGNAAHVNCPCGTEINNATWHELRARLVWELDQNPSGKTILALEMEEMDESSRCWKAKCSRCASLYYNRLETMKNIRACVEQLPKDV
ncbi:hypothetical protein AN958_11184 [Leucoagaricus sp. SymC.cos]|nr:hypothetical protein AN958_11184 [Leucoagaricus sp. SymC.cos]